MRGTRVKKIKQEIKEMQAKVTGKKAKDVTPYKCDIKMFKKIYMKKKKQGLLAWQQ